MDSPSDLFRQQPSQMCPFGLYASPRGSTPTAPLYPGGSPPNYPLISPLLHSNSASQRWGGYQHRQSFFPGPPLNNKMDEGVDEEVEDMFGARELGRGVNTMSQLIPGCTRKVSDPEPWNQDVRREKRLRMDNGIRGEGEMDREREGARRDLPRSAREEKRMEEEEEERKRKGRREGRQRQRQELKLQLEETRGRLLELQRKVWRVYGEQQTEEEQKGGEERGRINMEEVAEIFSDEERDDPVVCSGESRHLRASSRGEDRDRNGSEIFPDGTLDEDPELDGGEVWFGCSLVRGEWESPAGGQKFAQALKKELANAVARVIDRVVRLYAETDPSPPKVLLHETPSRRTFVSNPDDKQRPSRAASHVEQEEMEALPLVAKRPQEKRTPLPQGVQRNPLLPQPNPTLPPLPQAPVPALLPTRNKDPFLPSYPPKPPPFPLPLLHYTMQHLFARSLSNLPLHKDCLSSEPFLDFRSHAPSFPPLPLLSQLDPPLSDRGRDGGIRGGGGGADGGDSTLYLGAGSSQEGLSPCHLKKAKLMFFYTRYPSSNTLKTYFPDVKFNRCVTSQLIKWFSNFREFFYIQMERFARQAAREGLPAARDGALRLGRDSELYRILNMHYNKSNDYQVPDRFLEVSELALREFFSAIQSGRDADPCWKKSIYKIICKLDSPVPDSFRLPGCPLDAHRMA
ncbi:prospero homeobox 3 [Chanos chanos]|uniref:Prospero homeobox 3 n=1 Tax=Chanos chanos TaxID=29144 RepID=A0A6J2VV11_CHACN|nr:prospero homeobox protein 1-like [Chanos chanos]